MTEQKSEYALHIGRYQPLGLNHVDLFAQGSEQAHKLAIAVGQPNLERAKKKLTANQFAHYQLGYLFDFERTKEMIEHALPDTEHVIVPVQDIFDTPRYAAHVREQFAKHGVTLDDAVLIGENQWTSQAFKDSGIDVVAAQERVPYHMSDARKEVERYGYSDKIAADLTDSEKMRIIDTERLKKRLGKDGILKHNGYLKLIQKPHGEQMHDILVSRDAVAVLYIDHNHHVWLTKEYRKAVDRECIGLVAGTLDKPGKSQVEHVVDELQEEIGKKVEPSQVEYVRSVYSSEGHDTELVHLYIARGPSINVPQKLEESERIEPFPVTFRDAYRMMKNGEITGAKANILIQHLAIERLRFH